MKFNEMKHALACAAVQQRICKAFALDEARLEFANPHLEQATRDRIVHMQQRIAAKEMNTGRYFRRCAHNLRVAIASHRGRRPGGVGRVFGIQASNRIRRQQRRKLLAAVKEIGRAA